MTTFGYVRACEAWGPAELLDQATTPGFVDFYGTEVLPRARELRAAARS